MTFYEQEAKRIRNICHSNQKQIDTVIATRQYINNHFDQDVSLDKLSQEGFTSKYHLIRLFKRYYGCTPRQYLISKRIAQAKTYLAKGMSVTETCFAVGFQSPSSFCTLFKNRNGCTPSEFRLRNFRKVT